ncbi:MAG: D-glycerate dehydrogenase [Betaproteobacteria bacterium]|nr:D-glycerate dehydrogenase [Betaproteobacteria bacterium]
MKPKIIIARAVFSELVERLRQHFEVTDNQADVAWSKAEWTERLSQHVGAFSMGMEPVDEAVLQACPQLKICANMSVGYNNLDVPAMTRHGVLATNAPDVLTETTADFGFALMMATARRIAESEHYLRAGHWKQWRYDLFAGAEVHGSTLGIMGMGRIGQAIARRGAHGFGMPVVYHNRSRLSAEVEAACGARYVGKDELLQKADHLVLVVPYSKEAHHTIGAAELARMKPSATLTNIARGGIVDDGALIAALREGRIAAAGLDVFEGEPALNPGFLALKNVVLTPHIASSTVATRLAMAHLAADNLIDYLTQGTARTPLNPEVIGAAR